MMLQPKTWLHCSNGGKHTRLRISAAHNEWNHVGMALAAMAQGFFAEEGLSDVELISFDENEQTELLDREAVQVDLLARGAVDVAIDPRTTFVLEAKNQSKPVCIIGARRRNHAFVLVGEKGLKSIQDLRGKTVEAGQRGGANDIMMRQVLQDHGLIPDRDVEISYRGGPMHDSAGAIQAFTEGKYGPAILKTHVRPLIDAGYPVLADLNKLYPSRHDRVTAANEDFSRAHPEIVKAFLKCIIRACRFAIATENGKLKNKETFKDIVVNAGFLTSDREQRSFDNLFDDWQTRVSQDLSLPMEGIQLIVDEEKKAGKIAATFDVNKVLRLEALRQAQADLRLEY
jgi:ABC-type nitrate/sulfonate/bicarbonate transport system substrate-binding protein